MGCRAPAVRARWARQVAGGTAGLRWAGAACSADPHLGSAAGLRWVGAVCWGQGSSCVHSSNIHSTRSDCARGNVVDGHAITSRCVAAFGVPVRSERSEHEPATAQMPPHRTFMRWAHADASNRLVNSRFPSVFGHHLGSSFVLARVYRVACLWLVVGFAGGARGSAVRVGRAHRTCCRSRTNAGK